MVEVKRTLSKRARQIRLIGMDIDGVLTNGEVVVLGSGEEVKPWNVKDRFGFVLARQSGGHFRFAWISGRQSKTVLTSAKEFQIEAVRLGVRDKGKAYREITQRLGVRDREAAFIGDDLTDLPILCRVGLACCPRDAAPDVLKKVHFITQARGGQGVFREVLELILKSQGLWKGLLAQYAP